MPNVLTMYLHAPLNFTSKYVYEYDSDIYFILLCIWAILKKHSGVAWWLYSGVA